MPPATVAAAAAARRTASRGEPEPAVPEVNEGDGLRGRAPGRAGGSPEDRAFCAASPRNGERVDAAATASAAARSCGGMIGGGRGEGGDRAGRGDARRRATVAASDDPSRGTALPEAGTERARGVRGRATHPLVVALVRFAGARARRRFRRGGVFLVLFVDGGGWEGVRGRARSLHPDNARGGGTPCRESTLVASEAAAHLHDAVTHGSRARLPRRTRSRASIAVRALVSRLAAFARRGVCPRHAGSSPRRRRENGKYVSAVPITCRDDEIGSRAKLGLRHDDARRRGVARTLGRFSARTRRGTSGRVTRVAPLALGARSCLPPFPRASPRARPRPRTKPVEARGSPSAAPRDGGR